MASIVQRRNRYNVVYLYDAEDGKRKQKWESFKTLAEAKRRKYEVEYRQQIGSMVVPTCKTLEEGMKRKAVTPKLLILAIVSLSSKACLCIISVHI